MANKSGIQAQLADPAFKAMVEATLPYCLKVLDGARDLPLVNRWALRRMAMGGGVLMLRHVTGEDVQIADLPALTKESLRLFEGWRALATGGITVVLELPINEKFHTDLGQFADLAEASVPAAETIHEAGFRAGVLVTSEGNPPGDNYGAAFFLQPRVLACLRRFRQLGSIWCPHGYSHPPADADEAWHFDRPRHILAQLPEDARLNYAFGEMGCDGGCDLPEKKPGVGYAGYFDPDEGRIKRYADYARVQVARIAQDPLCVAGAFFLSGHDPAGRPNFSTFDVRDEVDFRPVLTEPVPGPDTLWLPTSSPSAPPISADPSEAKTGQQTTPGATSSKEVPVQLGLLYRMGSDIPETTVDAIAALCHRGGFTIISPKVKEAEAWMGGPERWQDKDPVLAITGVDALIAQRDAYAKHGITMHPWAVYRGLDWEAEAKAHAEVANLLKVLIVDFEWGYPGFADHGTWPDVVNYCALLRQLAPGATLVLCPDPRQITRREYPVGEIAGSFDAYSPQAYWTDFQQAAPDVLNTAIRETPPGLACWPMLPGNSDPLDLDAGIGQCLHVEAGPVFYVFQRVGLHEDNLPVLKAWADKAAELQPLTWTDTPAIPADQSGQQAGADRSAPGPSPGASSPVVIPATTDALNNLWDLTLQTTPQSEERRRSAQEAINVLKDALTREVA